MTISGTSDFHISPAATLEVKGNNDRGISISNSSCLRSEGTLLVDGNRERGISLVIASTLSSVGSLTVSNTTGNPGTGIHMFQSELHLEGGEVFIINNTGTVGHGIRASKSRISIINSSLAEIKENQGHGVGMFLNSDGMIGGIGVTIQNNGLSGVFADGGSVFEMWEAMVTGNTANDVVLEFGSQGTFYNSNFDQNRIQCGPGALIRGDRHCP